jgi:hypothetical protein
VLNSISIGIRLVVFLHREILRWNADRPLWLYSLAGNYGIGHIRRRH